MSFNVNESWIGRRIGDQRVKNKKVKNPETLDYIVSGFFTFLYGGNIDLINNLLSTQFYLKIVSFARMLVS